MTGVNIKELQVMTEVTSHLGICTNGAAAFSTGVGTELVEAAHTDVLAFLGDVLLPLQVVTAVETVHAVSHCGSGADIVTRSCRNRQTQRQFNMKKLLFQRRSATGQISLMDVECAHQSVKSVLHLANGLSY